MSLHAVAKDESRPRSGPDRYVPFTVEMGLKVERAEAGEATVSLDLRPGLLNNHGAGHGGVVMTLLDCAMANAALSRVNYEREVATIDMHIAFMRPTSGKLVATGRATGGGRSVCFCEASIVDADGEIAAQAMGTFRYRDVT